MRATEFSRVAAYLAEAFNLETETVIASGVRTGSVTFSLPGAWDVKITHHPETYPVGYLVEDDESCAYTSDRRDAEADFAVKVFRLLAENGSWRKDEA